MKFSVSTAVLGLLLLAGTSHAQTKPLDLTVQGAIVQPRFLPYDRNLKPEQLHSLAFEAKKEIIVLPAFETTINGMPAKFGIRPRRDGFYAKAEFTFR